MMTDLPTPEELLNRAMDALDKAEAKTDPFYTADWIGVSQAATMAGQLALDIRQAEPRTVGVDDLSKAWRDGIENITTDPALKLEIEKPGDPRVVEGRQVWVNPDELRILLALRTGAVSVVPADVNQWRGSVEARQAVLDRLSDAMGTPTHPTDADEPVVTLGELNANMNDQERRYRTIIVGLLLARSTVSDYVPGPLIRQTPPWRLKIDENPADGAVTLRIERS